MQGLGTGSISLFGSDGAEAQISAAGARRQGDRRLRAVRAGGRLRRRGAGDDRQAGRRACPARRRKDLDLERRHRRPLRGVRAHRRGAGRARAVGLRGRCRHAGADGRRAHRGDRAASAGDGLRSTACRVPVANRLGKPGEGFKVAMATLDIFRSTVGAAALGFARRALHETVEHAATRKLFGAPLGDLQMTQAAIADSATEVDAAALLVYRAAWTKDKGAARVTREAAMAKMFATEAAQRVIDRAVQLHGGARRHQGRQGRGALPRNPRAAHLRGRDRGAEDRDRARDVEAAAGESRAGGGMMESGDGPDRRSRRYVRAGQSAAARAVAGVQVRRCRSCNIPSGSTASPNGSTAGSRPGRATAPCLHLADRDADLRAACTSA